METTIKYPRCQQITGLLLLFFSLIILHGCSLIRGGSHSCSSMESWVNETQTLAKIGNRAADPNRLTTPEIAQVSFPLFSDDKFIPTFGKSYFAMSESERTDIYYSLKKCFKEPYVRHALVLPFLPDSKRTGTAAEWNRYLAAARTTTYKAETAKRKQMVLAIHNRKKQRAEQQHRMVEMKKRRAEAARKQYEEKRKQLANFKYEQVSGPFDSIEGGSFFNALYKGDAGSINRQNKEYSNLKMQQYQLFMGKADPTDAIVGALYKQVRLLDSVKAMYLFRYQDKYGRCLRKDAVKFKVVETTPDVVYENLLGIEVARHYGYTTRNYFKVNRDFETTFRRIGKIKPENLSMAFMDLFIGGGGSLSNIVKGKGPQDLRNQLIVGTKQIMAKFSCDSPEIQQLEKNMLKIR